jgi:hypothetical protein
VVIVGDSTAHANGDGLKAWGDANGRLDVLDVVWGNGCTALTGKAALVRDGYIAKPKDCDTLFDRAADSVATNQPDAVLVFIGSSQLLDWRFGADPTWHNILEPPFDAQYVVALRTAVEKLAAGGVPILWADLPIPAWDLDKFGEELGSPLPGSGPVTMNSPPRTAELNELTVVTFTPETNVVIWPYAEHLSNPDGSVDPSLRPDGLHLSMDGVATIADAWLYQDLHASYLDALQMFPTTLSAARATAWSAPS